MKNIIRLLSIMLLLSSCEEQTQQKQANDKIKVYILGTFHFAQTDSTYNILDEKHQKSIERLTQIIAEQKPEKVFLERQPEFMFKIKTDTLYQLYLDDDRIRYKNEIYQVGFRVAKNLDHPRVYLCDNPGMYGNYYSEAKKYAEKNGQLEILEGTSHEKGMTIREDNRVNEDSIMQNTSLLEYMQWLNREVNIKTSHTYYINNLTQVGSKDYYNYDDDNTLLGAEITADWYRRNIMIYTKIINQLSYDEKAIFLLIGSDHIPTLSNLFRDNPYFEVVKAEEWLKD